MASVSGIPADVDVDADQPEPIQPHPQGGDQSDGAAPTHIVNLTGLPETRPRFRSSLPDIPGLVIRKQRGGC